MEFCIVSPPSPAPSPSFVLYLFCLSLLLDLAAPLGKDVLIRLVLGTLEPKGSSWQVLVDIS